MFPPIFREEKKRIFNQYALQRIRLELSSQGSMVGFHPEGKRNKDEDPYTFLPAKKGVGEVIYNTPDAQVVPIYIQGMSNQIFGEIITNWFAAEKNPIHVYFGPAQQYNTFRQQEEDSSIHQTISEECMADIQKLAEQHKQSVPT